MKQPNPDIPPCLNETMQMPELTDRQQKLLELLHSRGKLSTEEIKRRFSISAATASRDIHALVLAGEAIQTGHGLKMAPPQEPIVQERKCFYCGGPVNDRVVFIIQMEDGSQRNACCPHCGVMAIDQPGTQNALVRDFIFGRMVNAARQLMCWGVRSTCAANHPCSASLARRRRTASKRGSGGKHLLSRGWF